MLNNELPHFVGKACSCAELVFVTHLLHIDPSLQETLADVQRSKVLLSGARVYNHLPLHPLSRPGQGLDELTGTACNCVAYQSRLSACEKKFSLGVVRKLKC